MKVENRNAWLRFYGCKIDIWVKEIDISMSDNVDMINPVRFSISSSKHEYYNYTE